MRRHFDPYIDINWDAPEFSVRKSDPRWALPTSDPLGGHPWYQAQPLEKQIEIGLWHQANTAKVSLQLESILIRGLMHYTFWVPNGSPEYRYCVHESIEECNHAMMFQELVNRIGVNAPGMPRWLRWISAAIPLYAGPLPGTFFFGVLAGELPIHHMQKNMLREEWSPHPIMEKVMAIHVAEEARHISFADQFLSRRVPHMVRRSRFTLSLYVPIVMRALGQAIVVPSRSFFRKFDIPRSVRKEVFFRRAQFTAGVARHVRRRSNAVRGRRADESISPVALAYLQNQWSTVPLPRRTAARSRGTSSGCSLNPLLHNTSGDHAITFRWHAV